jgi:anti-anti-sigma regulatory factor
MEGMAILQVLVGKDGRSLRVEGRLVRDSVSRFEREVGLAPSVDGLLLDLSELDIEDPAGAVSAVNAIRRLAARGGAVVVRGAPQLLAHNLYRCGLLGGPIALVDTRQDEAYG